MTTVNPLEHIAFEYISDEYCYGKYGDFNVIMMKKNGYINATKMCRDISEQTESKKEFRNWKENKSVRDRIKENLDGKISCTNNKFRIFKKYTETELMEDVRKINDEKFEV